jgi:integrase
VARLDLVTTRAKLPVRHPPYWRTIRRGQAIGYRKTRAGGTWLARIFVGGKMPHRTLGAEIDLTYEQALEAAEDWWRVVTSGAPRGYDVLAALEDYAATKTANADERERERVWPDLTTLNKHVSGEFLAREVADLKTAELERWRDAMQVKPATRRRVFTILAAALSNGYRLHGAGDPSVWRRVKAVKIPKATRARLFIPTEKEIKDLLAACQPDFAALVRAALLTGCRYGELAALEVRDFDPGKGALSLRESKTGEREMLLSSAAVAFFAGETRGKLPRARMFTTAEGGPWEKSMQHRRMRAAATIRAFVFYSLRHYALSRQLAASIPAALVAKNAGTSEAMLRAHYHKFIAEDRSIFDRAPAIV